MPNAKTIVKKAPRKRGTVSLAKVRQAVAAVSVRNGAGRSIHSTIKLGQTRKSSRAAHAPA